MVYTMGSPLHHLVIIGIFLWIVISGVNGLPTPNEWKINNSGLFNTLTKDEIDGVVLPFISNGTYVGIVVTLVDPQGYAVYEYGVSDKETGAVPTAETRFGIGSVTKIFTGILLADAENHGLVNLTVPISRYIPGVAIPSRNDREITLKDLATHTSGLPEGLEKYQKEGDDAMNARDGVAYERAFLEYSLTNGSDIYPFISNITLTRDPGTQWEYSNMGAALVGDILVRKQNCSFEQLLNSTILIPLGMNNTTAHPSELPKNAVATGYRGYFDGNITKGFLLNFTDFWAPTGGIFSTGDDMAIFLAANLGLVDSPLNEAIHESMVPRAVRMKEPLVIEQSLFWDTIPSSDSRRIYMKSGESNTFQSQILLRSPDGFGVVVLANTAYIESNRHVEVIAYELMKRMLNHRGK